jgi:small ligand-binding sensory domain FIST
MMQWSTSISREEPLEDALFECLQEIQSELGTEPISLALAFITPHHAGLSRRLPELVNHHLAPDAFVGCSGGGVIGGGREIEGSPSLTLTAARMPGVSVNGFHLSSELPDLDGPPQAWEELFGVNREEEPQFILLSDPFSGRPDALLAGLDYAFPESVKVGGLASGGTSPGTNTLFAGDQVYGGGTVGVVLSGDVVVDTVVAQGCRPVGEIMHVTRCEGNILYELDGEKALEVLRGLVGEMDPEDQQLARNSLFVGMVMDEFEEEPGAGDFLIRNLLGADPQSGALAVGESLQEGMRVRFHLRDAASSAGDLRGLLTGYRSQVDGPDPSGALLFSCLGRGEGLYGEPNFDTSLFRDHLGRVPVGGFFCNGEIGPVGGRTFLHGYTSSFGIFRPRKSA